MESIPVHPDAAGADHTVTGRPDATGVATDEIISAISFYCFWCSFAGKLQFFNSGRKENDLIICPIFFEYSAPVTHLILSGGFKTLTNY